MAYFDQIDPINDTFDQIYVHKPDLNNFKKLLQKKYLTSFPKFWPVAPFWPKMTQFWPFSPKMTYLDQIDTINNIFDQIDVHKPDWNNFRKFYG